MLFIPRKRLFYNSARGLTLAEILVASVIVSITLAGILSANYAISKMSASSAGETRLYMQMTSMAEHIRLSALSAAGDNSVTDGCDTANSNLGYGIRICPANGYMCFRIPNTATPYDYSTATWRCYDWVTTANRMLTCSNVAATPGLCPGGQDLGPVATDVFTCAAPECYYPTLAGNYLRFKLVNSRNVGNAQLSAGKLTKGTADNPQVSADYTVFAESHSF